MNANVRKLVRSFTPPVVLDVFRKLRGPAKLAGSREFDLQLPHPLVKQVLERNDLA